jgi:hypothetical protein
MVENAEARSRLPIALLVASGYVLGVMVPVPRPSWRWLNEAGAWGVILPFALLFYSGRERLLDLMREMSNGQRIELTKADDWYAKFVRFAQGCLVVSVCIGLGVGAAYLSKNSGLSWYTSGIIGFFIAFGSVVIVFDS